jgi:hypothetical protein
MWHYIRAAIIVALLLPAMHVAAQENTQAQINVYGLKIDGRNVEVLFRVVDPVSERDLQGLDSREFEIFEDGTPVLSRFELDEVSSSADKPTLTVDLAASGVAPVNGSKPVELSVVGSTIGIVYDASTLINAPGDSTNYVEQGRTLIEAFLEAGRPVASANPENIGLFLPLSVPAVEGESIRPAELAEFSQDRNAAINVLRQMAPRESKTNVFDTIAVAVRDTAETAARRGTDAYVLVVTDGGDSASAGSFDALIDEANQRGVRLLVLGMGPADRLAANAATLTTLAERTGGAYLGNPPVKDVQSFYNDAVAVTGQSAYLLQYETTLLDDGEEHFLTIEVDGVASGRSEAIPLFVDIGSGSTVSIELGPVLQSYAMRAVPAAILLSLVLTFVMVMLRKVGGTRGTGGSLSGGVTRR